MKKRGISILMACLMLVLAAGCGSSSKDSAAVTTQSAAGASYSVAEEKEADYEAAEEVSYDNGSITSENGLENTSAEGRKLIKTVYMELQTKEFDSVLEALPGKVEELGGYIENSTLSGSSYYYESTRSADYTARIPADRLDEFVEIVGGLGNVSYKSESVEDVTLQYVDTESRKKALETEQERLLELLEQAENMEDLLAIESKLSDVRYELENYGSQLRLLDNQIDYSSVSIHIEEVERITETKDRTFFEEVEDRFSDSLYDVGQGLRSFAVWFLGSLPVLVVWAVVIVVIVAVLRLILKKRPRRERKKLRLFGKQNPPEN